SPWLKTTNNFLNNHLKLARFAADIFPNLCINNSAINVPLCVDRAMAPKNDLCHEKISLRTAADRERDARLVMENASKGRPVYLFTGDNDLVCIPSAARRFADLAGKSCVFRMWEGLGHETMNESAWEDVLDAVITWLDGMLV
ncbi:MAG: alpha/beta hydrolase, partial [Clostridiales bacterium]|nr:alpha/beta hydrolase [Clostridiales bacterium]